jgi:hypothetical protein
VAQGGGPEFKPHNFKKKKKKNPSQQNKPVLQEPAIPVMWQA